MKSNYQLVQKLIKHYNSRIKNFNGSIHVYNKKKGIWEVTEEYELEKQVCEWDGDHTSPVRTKNAITTLKQKTGCKAFIPNRNKIAFENGTLNIKKNKFSKHSYKNKLLNCLPFKYDAKATCPNWINFLNQSLEEDKAKIKTIKTIFGHIIGINTDYENFFILYGKPGSGKSTVLDMMEFIVGKENISALFLDELNDKFRLKEINNKLVIIAHEIRIDKKIDWALVKTLSGGKAINVDVKGKEGFVLKSYASIVVATNQMPDLKRIVEGLERRMIVIPFNNVVKEKDRVRGLAKKIFDQEKSGIFNWALEGYHMLHDSEIFKQPKFSKRIVREYMEGSDPIKMWAKKFLKKSPQEKTRMSELHDHYSKFATKRKHPAMADNKLSKHLQELGFVRKRDSKGVYFQVEINDLDI